MERHAIANMPEDGKKVKLKFHLGRYVFPAIRFYRHLTWKSEREKYASSAITSFMLLYVDLFLRGLAWDFCRRLRKFGFSEPSPFHEDSSVCENPSVSEPFSICEYSLSVVSGIFSFDTYSISSKTS